MSATLIRTEIDRLFGDMTRDKRTALRDMRAIARQANEYADLLDDDELDDWDDEDFDDFDDFDDDDYEDDDDFDDDYEDDDDDYLDDDEDFEYDEITFDD